MTSSASSGISAGRRTGNRCCNSRPSSVCANTKACAERRMVADLHDAGTTVETSLGPVATAELGPTLMHEHIVTRSPGVHENWPHLFDRDAILAIAERKMADLHGRGIRAIVDLTTVDLGRDIDLIVAVARRSRVHVIVAAGDDLGYLRGLMERGSTIGMDPFGLEHFLPTAKRVEGLARLCAEGYAGKMVLSHDANCWTDMVSEDDTRRTRPLWHYNHISDDILPALRKAGVTEDQIEQMLVRNPRAIFEAPKKANA